MTTRNNEGGVTIRHAYSSLYVASAAYACAVTSHNSRRGDAGGVLCGSAPRLYDSTDRVLLSDPVPGGYKYGDLVLQVGGVSNLRQQNMVMSPAGLGPENDCAGENQQQF
jgi:hypothetical protein